ncbi:MAG TPA: hypothetical protein VHN77_13295 [Phycisphaerales bacterium]|nr:hypothetical protein [Phycisphaerales bacterium]
MRDLLNKYPWLGWVIAALLLGVSIWLYLARTSGADAYDPESMKEMLTIRYTDTDEVERIPRGRLDQMLRRSGNSIDPKQGIINPKTGKPTGFLVDEDEWTQMIERINQEKEAIRQESGGKARIAPRPTTTPTPEQLQKFEDASKNPPGK